MTILETATSRRTTRKYKQDPVSEDDIRYVLETIRQSPSGSNAQPWQVIIVDDLEVKKAIREASEEGEMAFYESISPERRKGYNAKGLSPSKPLLTEAPVLLVVLGDTTAPNYKPSVWVSIGFAILASEERGLSTVTYTPSDPVLVTVALSAPEGYLVEAILPLGYSDDPKPKEPRKPVEEFTQWNKGGHNSH
ncbi:nitroreductase family protein [Candidatus Bathyarchaeota archaeon]|nr:nitroreductase family protein [Candidatus Bathyarchaeota archaeon]